MGDEAYVVPSTQYAQGGYQQPTSAYYPSQNAPQPQHIQYGAAPQTGFIQHQSFHNPPQQNVVYQQQPMQAQTTVTVSSSSVDQDNPTEYDQSKMLLIVGFFFNIVWIFNFVISRGKGPKTQKMGNISCGLFVGHIVLSFLITVAVLIIYFAIFAAAAVSSSTH
jgi:hypothetical protein